KENIPLVDAVKMAAAEAYLTLKRPEEAVAIYQEILKRRPHDFQARLHLVHAVILQHKFVEAEGMIRVLKRQEASPTIRKQGILEPNWRKVEVEAAEIWLSAYRDQLAQAEKRFKLLLDQAPMNSSLHSGLAHLYLWRGWPRKALREFEQILHYDPRYVGVRVGYATTLMGMNRHEKARAELARLVEQAPFSPHVRQLQKELRVHDQNELWAYSNFRREERGSRAWYAETSLNSRPVFSRYRITADLIRQDSRADNDQFTYTRFNAGLSYAGEQGLTLRQKISFDLESTGHTGAITDALYQLNDYWRVDARYDSFSLNVPVRASVAGITAKALDLGVLYRPHERTETRLSLSQIRLSDGNRRNRYSLQTQYKLVPGAIYTHFLQFYLSRSRNSLDGRVYFNPRNDLSYALTTRHQWRRNDTRPGREFRHALSGTLGVYDQAGFSSGLTGELRYAHEWDFAVGETLAYHLAYNRRIFDGEADYVPTFNIRFIHHF
ncbi:MAG: tetratricopeptide repeat protein, partial [Nitrospiria bacterium]